MPQQVFAVLVIAGVRDRQAAFVQPRGPSQQLTAGFLVQFPLGQNLLQQAQRGCLDIGSMAVVHAVTLSQRRDRDATDIAVAEPADQIVQHAFTQRALGGEHAFELEAVEHAGQHRQPAGEHRAPVLAQIGVINLVHVAAVGQQLQGFFQTVAGDFVLDPAFRAHHAPGAADGAGGTNRDVPAGFAITLLEKLQLDPRRQPRLAQALFGDGAVLEKSLRVHHTPQRDAFHLARLAVLAEDQLGAAAADIHHQPARRRVAQAAGHPGVNQPRFLAAGDDLDVVTERAFGRSHEVPAFAQLAQRVGADHAHPLGRNAGQALAKALQTGQGPGLRLGDEFFLVIQPGRDAHRLAQLIPHLQVGALRARHDQVEAVGSQINGRDFLNAIVLAHRSCLASD